MDESHFYKLQQRRIAQACIGTQALRNQGSAGMVEVARLYCEHLNIKEFFSAIKSKQKFKAFLDIHTYTLMILFPGKGKRNFGAARKVLNIFFREIVYNHYLASKHFKKKFSANRVYIQYLELPLDSHVATGIKKDYNGKLFLKWSSIKKLNESTSTHFQEAAQTIAHGFKIARIHLDLRYWRGIKTLQEDPHLWQQ